MHAPASPAGARTPAPRLRLGLLLWGAGLLGVAATAWLLMPGVVVEVAAATGEPLPLPVWAIALASLFQSAVLLALLVWLGVALAPSLGLHAPAFEALAAGRPVGPALRPQWRAGVLGGVLGAALLVAFAAFAPAPLRPILARFSPPLVVRVLYGGFTEELLLRWGLMTGLLWLAWRFLQQRRGAPRAGYVWLAIAASALLFGAGHLPLATLLGGPLPASSLAVVVGVNAAFGVVAGWLFWRYGLEAAMLAHVVAHLVAFAFGYLR